MKRRDEGARSSVVPLDAHLEPMQNLWKISLLALTLIVVVPLVFLLITNRFSWLRDDGEWRTIGGL